MEVMGENIKYYRNSFHLSQNYVAKYLCLSLENYDKLEHGRSTLSENDVEKLCILFGISSTQLTTPICPMGLFYYSDYDDDEDYDWDVARADAQNIRYGN